MAFIIKITFIIWSIFIVCDCVTTSIPPTNVPTILPTNAPSFKPTVSPTNAPTSMPTAAPISGDCTCYATYHEECPADKDNRAWIPRDCRRMKPNVRGVDKGKPGKGGKHNDPKFCTKVYGDGKSVIAPCDGLCGPTKAAGEMNQTPDDIEQSRNEMRFYYDAFRFAALQPGITELDQMVFVEMDGSVESAESYTTQYYLSYSIMALVNYIWGEAVIHHPNGTHLVQTHTIDEVTSILVNTSDVAVAIINEQLLQGMSVGVDASIIAAVDEFHDFVVENEGELIANDVNVSSLEGIVDKYFDIMLTELALN